MNPAVDNLLALYHRNAQRADDVAWYADAKREVARRAADHGLNTRTYAGVVAATSPMQQWATKDGLRFPNLDTADRAVRWHRGELDKPGTFGQNARNAAAILNGADPNAVLGPKTRPFWRALLGYDDIVLDRWALRAIGWPRESIKEHEWPTAAEPYMTAAAQLGIRPSELQAATWVQIKREAGR